MYVSNNKMTTMCCLWLLDASLATDAAVAHFASQLQRQHQAQSKCYSFVVLFIYFSFFFFHFPRIEAYSSFKIYFRQQIHVSLFIL